MPVMAYGEWGVNSISPCVLLIKRLFLWWALAKIIHNLTESIMGKGYHQTCLSRNTVALYAFGQC